VRKNEKRSGVGEVSSRPRGQSLTLERVKRRDWGGGAKVRILVTPYEGRERLLSLGLPKCGVGGEKEKKMVQKKNSKSGARKRFLCLVRLGSHLGEDKGTNLRKEKSSNGVHSFARKESQGKKDASRGPAQEKRAEGILVNTKLAKARI